MTKNSPTIDPTELSCLKLETFIDDYLDNKLPGAKRDVFEAHIDYCPGCYNFLTNYRNAVHLGKTAYAGEDEASCETMPENLVEAILRASKV